MPWSGREGYDYHTCCHLHYSGSLLVCISVFLSTQMGINHPRSFYIQSFCLDLFKSLPYIVTSQLQSVLVNAIRTWLQVCIPLIILAQFGIITSHLFYIQYFGFSHHKFPTCLITSQPWHALFNPVRTWLQVCISLILSGQLDTILSHWFSIQYFAFLPF